MIFFLCVFFFVSLFVYFAFHITFSKLVLKLTDETASFLRTRIWQEAMDAFPKKKKKELPERVMIKHLTSTSRDQNPRSSEKSEQGDYSKPSIGNGL